MKFLLTFGIPWEKKTKQIPTSKETTTTTNTAASTTTTTTKQRHEWKVQ